MTPITVVSSARRSILELTTKEFMSFTKTTRIKGPSTGYYTAGYRHMGTASGHQAITKLQHILVDLYMLWRFPSGWQASRGRDRERFHRLTLGKRGGKSVFMTSSVCMEWDALAWVSS